MVGLPFRGGTGQYYFSSSLADLLVGAFTCISIGPECGLCRRSGPLGFARQFALWGGSAFSGRGGVWGGEGGSCEVGRG